MGTVNTGTIRSSKGSLAAVLYACLCCFFYGYLRRQDDTAVLATMKSILVVVVATVASAFIDLVFVSLLI
jgi:hypothetical protein